MDPTFTPAPDADFQLALDGGSTLTRLTGGLLPGGAYRFEDTLDLTQAFPTTIITCTAWLLELYHLDAGEVAFRHGAATVQPASRRFGVFYPPFALAQPTLRAARGRVVGVAATAPLPPALAAGPLLFDTSFDDLPAAVADVFAIVARGRAPQRVDAFPHAGLLARAAKQLIDDNHAIYPSIGRVAARLGVSHAHLSRQFKRAYELSPSAYLHQLRLADTPLRLARGEAILDVSSAVGYNDLSRFYKQFRRHTHASPGACQHLLEPGAA